MRHSILALAVAGALSSAMASANSGSIVHIANNGVDTPTCGTPSAPCRSISQGIVNAAAGDTLVVRPGRYGDLDGDGQGASPGEENGGSIAGSTGGVYVNKRLTIISSAGADATLIDMRDATSAVVYIAADGVKFGERGAGFTVTGAQAFGINTGPVTRVVIAGNTATKLPFCGFMLGSAGLVEVRDNTAVSNLSSGFVVLGTSPVALTNNSATGNIVGIAVGPFGAHRIVANDVIGNEIGLAINYGPSRFSQNYVAGNRTGASINGYSDAPIPNGPVIVRNSFIGNGANGIDVYQGPDGVTPTIRENNIFGNGNCGTSNQTNLGGNPGFTVDARNNFWGAVTGPSFQDPADEACMGLHPTLSVPYATREFLIR